MPGDTPLLVGALEAARLLSLSESTLFRLTRCNAIPSHKVRGRRLYAPAELQAWLAAGAPTTPDAAAGLRREVRP